MTEGKVKENCMPASELLALALLPTVRVLSGLQRPGPRRAKHCLEAASSGHRI